MGAAIIVSAFFTIRPKLSTAPAATSSPKVSSSPAITHWHHAVHVPGVFDVARSPTTGELVVAVQDGLARLGTRFGDVQNFAPDYHDGGGEAYIAVPPRLHAGLAGCDFFDNTVYALHLTAPFAVTYIHPLGAPSQLAVVPGVEGLNGIGFDTVGSFNYELLVTGPSHGATVVTAINCQGRTRQITSSAPPLEGGIAVAPNGFGAYGGNLIGPDENSGLIVAIAADGKSTVIAESGLPIGGDIGVESLGFVPPGFIAGGGDAYVADRGTPGSPHPGTDSVLRLSAAELAAAGVADGDLLAVTEASSLTIAVRCRSTAAACTLHKVATGPEAAHGEGHVVFVLRRQ